MLVRGIKRDDLDQITEIEKTCFSLPWSRESYERELDNKLAYYQCAEENGVVMGYMGMWRILDECHITNVAVLPQYRKKGVATHLINKMIEICKCSEITQMTLEVRESNIPAINLYKKFGFLEHGKRPRYYQAPIEDAIIMWKRI
ncbi:ribosomal protein S18-alanine N-acetyltransferase [Sedimentibacter hydroxybenzoicus DSM 7310]|uniref:[Ribosomal protein bS18]-alanine N-acetyltransferase n=1 Tax=Sedimentibacter hydroxybenzoicus DSM 7310 TaxID=1123245 RepID=A0A974BIP9_SEDHY|nr:ribosomal protein S18-alanine N-acetyltransferase [Sedimentibacter hydroxybenzoicus]NYB73908.1 ribosomal protein S18-alanine N-acetyltransferase [Sedimentibacter hydroxybenzoicus DSM 7310]